MAPLSEDKFLLKFLGKTLLQYQIEQARKAGLDEFILIGNPNNMDKIKAVAERIPELSFTFVVQERPLGMANALQSAQAILPDEPIIVVNPNDVFEGTAYTNIMEEYRRNPATAHILACKTREYFPGGYLVVNTDGEITAIKEKPGKGNEPSDLVNMVVHLHTKTKQFLQRIATIDSSADDIYEQVLSKMIDDGYKIKAVQYIDFWGAIKYPWNIFSVMEHFLTQTKQNISPKAAISSKAVIEGDVVIEDGVRVLENAVIKGPCYIGRDSIIGNNVLIRDGCHIGEGCVVGYDTEIKHCYIGDRCWFHKNYFGDSIVSNDCSFGAGTITANLRLDERNVSVGTRKNSIDIDSNKLGAIIGKEVRTGINASIMPGIRIGNGCFVGPHICLTRDLPAGKMALATGKYRVINGIARDIDHSEESSS